MPYIRMARAWSNGYNPSTLSKWSCTIQSPNLTRQRRSPRPGGGAAGSTRNKDSQKSTEEQKGKEAEAEEGGEEEDIYLFHRLLIPRYYLSSWRLSSPRTCDRLWEPQPLRGWLFLSISIVHDAKRIDWFLDKCNCFCLILWFRNRDLKFLSVRTKNPCSTFNQSW